MCTLTEELKSCMSAECLRQDTLAASDEQREAVQLAPSSGHRGMLAYGVQASQQARGRGLRLCSALGHGAWRGGPA